MTHSEKGVRGIIFLIVLMICAAGALTAHAELVSFTYDPTGQLLTEEGEGGVGAQLAPGSHDFGEVAAGTATPESHTFTLTNDAYEKSAYLHDDVGNINSVSVDDLITVDTVTVINGPADFSIDPLKNNCNGVDLRKQLDQCEFDVLFAPGSTGLKEAMVKVELSVPEGASLYATLSGTGTVVPLTVVPDPHDFQKVYTGRPSAPQSFTVTNNNLIGITATAVPPANTDFALQINLCDGGVLSPSGGFCTPAAPALSISYSPLPRTVREAVR
jgi:hypothetical protein